MKIKIFFYMGGSILQFYHTLYNDDVIWFTIKCNPRMNEAYCLKKNKQIFDSESMMERDEMRSMDGIKDVSFR